LTDENPPYGIAGWDEGGRVVFLNSRFDVWSVLLHVPGSAPLSIGGSIEQIEHRLLHLDRDAKWVDRSKPLYFSMYGELTKKSGYARLAADGPQVGSDSMASGRRRDEVLRYTDARCSSLQKAKYADVFAFTEQTVTDSPDIFIAGPNLAEPRQVTKT